MKTRSGLDDNNNNKFVECQDKNSHFPLDTTEKLKKKTKTLSTIKLTLP